MKIRDIQKYIEGYSPQSSYKFLGTDKEKFLETLYGLGQEIDATIRDVASFASNSEEQLFYEFVQNAFDANADSLCFFVDKDYLIVLNNGEPFYTDKYESKKLRDGQLYNFLAKGKSLKAGDQTKSGEYGQGSKLLYTLISDKSTASNKTQLLKAIKEKRRGPYLVSWGTPEQLSDFRFREPEWEYNNPYAADSDLLIIKILMTYYPIAPGIDENLFSTKEYLQMRDAFERLVDPKSNINRLSKGSAIIVSLGQGQYEAISAENNLKKVSQRLGGFAALTSDKEKNHGKHLDHIYVCGTEVEMNAVQSLFISFEKDDENFNYQFAFNPVFAKNECVNLYKTLPIIQAHYRLGFLIDNQNFELDSSRQRINDTSKTKLQLTEAFTRLADRISEVRTSDPSLFDTIYTSIVESQPLKKDVDSQFISEPFYEVFQPFIKKNIKTEDGQYLPLINVAEAEDGEPYIPLKSVGIDKIHWINGELSKGKLKNRFDLNEMRTYRVDEILSDANPSKLTMWIKSLDKNTYLTIHHYLVSHFVTNDKVRKNTPVFLTNKGNVVSFDYLINPASNVFLYRKAEDISCFERCPDIEYALGDIDYDEDELKNTEIVNLKKVVKNLDFFRASSSHIDAGCSIISSCSINDRHNRTRETINHHIPLFQNLKGEYRTFSDLIACSPDGTAILSDFCVAGYVPDSFADKWMISKKDDIWHWLCDHLDSVTDLGDWPDYHDKYLKDITTIYNNAGKECSKERIRIYLDKDGTPGQDKLLHLNAIARLSAEEYELVSDFAEIQGYPLVSQKFSSSLTTAPFELDDVAIEGIIDDRASVDSRLLDIIIRLYNSILKKYRIDPSDDGFTLVKNDHSKYVCKFRDPAADNVLEELGYIRIDDKVLPHFKETELANFNLLNDTKLLKNAIEKCDEDKILYLIPYIQHCNDEIIELYYDSVTEVDIDDKVTASDNRWLYIQLAVSKMLAGNNKYRERLLKTLSYDGDSLPNTIKSNQVEYNGTTYDLYKLLDEVKEENEVTENLAACLPDGKRFLDAMYAKYTETIEADTVFDELRSCYLNLEQLRFCLDYAIHEQVDDNLELDEKVPLSQALTMISKYQFKDFDEYLILEDFNKEVQVLGNKDLLLEEEKIPTAIQKWLSSDSVAQSLITGLIRESEPYIAFRKSFVDDTPFSNIAAVVSDSDKLKRTIQWIVSKKYDFVAYSEAYFKIQSLLTSLSEDLNNIPAFRITGRVNGNEADGTNQVLTAEYISPDGALVELDSILNPDITRIMASRDEIRTFFNSHMVYGFPDNDFLLRHEISAMSRYQLSFSAEEKKYDELSDSIYNKWKTLPASEGVMIFTSKKPIGTLFSITDISSQSSVLEVKTHDNRYGYNEGLKKVIIQYPNADNLTEMKTLEDASLHIEFFKSPFIALQGLYIDMMQDLTPEQMAIVAANKDKIGNLLEDMSTDDDDSPESKVRQLIGFIGEQIYKFYLEKNGTDFEYSAGQGVGEYDFKLPGTPDIFVDVKTNLYSFVDSAVPFYIHKTQNKFMQEHPEAQYRIARISLTDIRLKQEYEHIRNYFGADADYQLNQELRERCVKIAENYWKGAQIKEFDAVSPEYGIRIERKK